MATEKPFEFDKVLKELEDITAWFESSDTDLDAGLAKFERGMELASELKTHLAGVENRIEKIKRRFEGGASASAADHEPTALAQPAQPENEDPAADQAGLF